MFLIDLNRMYVKIVNDGRVWSHDLDEIEFMVPDNELVHVRRGREVTVMPLVDVHQWLWPFGPFDAHDDAYPVEYVREVKLRRKPVPNAVVGHSRSANSARIPF